MKRIIIKFLRRAGAKTKTMTKREEAIKKAREDGRREGGNERKKEREKVYSGKKCLIL